MTIKEALVTYLRSDVDLMKVIGDRLRPDHLSWNDTLPGLVFSVISETRDLLLEGGTDGTPTARLQFDSFGKTAGEAEEVRLNLLRLLEATGNSLPTHWGDVVVCDLRVDDSCRDNYEPGPLGGDLGRYRLSSDVLVTYVE